MRPIHFTVLLIGCPFVIVAIIQDLSDERVIANDRDELPLVVGECREGVMKWVNAGDLGSNDGTMLTMLQYHKERHFPIANRGRGDEANDAANAIGRERHGRQNAS